MQFRKVHVNRDETTSILALVPEWEIPLLEAVHGEERLTLGELVEVKNREVPTDVKLEFQRLSQLYGSTGSGDNALSFAERVYGHGSVGVKNLERAMDEARGAKRSTGRKAKASEDLIGAAG